MKLSQVLPISKSSSPRTVNFDKILIKILALNYDACTLPFCWVGSHLILNEDLISKLKGREGLSVSRPSLMVSHMTLSECSFPVKENLSPCMVRVVVARGERKAITNLPTEDSKGRREFGDRINSIPVGEDCSMKTVDI